MLWGRLLLLKYSIQLGESDDINVNWTDYDIKCKKIVLNDESEEFQPVVPKGLYKSVTQIFVKGNTYITITIFYTTFNCLVQGNVTQSWVETEFKLLNQKVQEFTKKGEGTHMKLLIAFPWKCRQPLILYKEKV